MRKTLSTVCLLALLLPMARATSTLPFYESFSTNHAEGSTLTTAPAATVWDSGNGAGSGAVTVASAAALSSTSGLATSNGSRGLVLTGTPSSNRDRGASFTSQTLGSNNPPYMFRFSSTCRFRLQPTGCPCRKTVSRPPHPPLLH